MGWLFNNRVPGDISAEIERLCTQTDNDRHTRPVRITRSGSVWYVAVEMTLTPGAPAPEGYHPDPDGRFVFGAVFRTRRAHGGWGYRLDEETVGPVNAGAPKALIGLLSPTSSEWAIRWRERCLCNAALRSRRLQDGDVIRLKEPLTFSDGRERQDFRVIRERPAGYSRGRTVFECVVTGARCRIFGFRGREWMYSEEPVCDQRS